MVKEKGGEGEREGWREKGREEEWEGKNKKKRVEIKTSSNCGDIGKRHPQQDPRSHLLLDAPHIYTVQLPTLTDGRACGEMEP